MADLYTWMGKSERLADLTVSSEGATRARAIVALDALAGRELVNDETGIKAWINKPQRNKIMSSTAIEKTERNGFSSTQHFAVAARIEGIWKHAAFSQARADKDGDKNIASIKRLNRL